MVATPKVLGPDDVARELTIFSTTMPSRPFQGTMAPDTVDMQISIRGGAFTSDPDLIVFEGTTFSFPNPTTFPEGLELAAGLNVIEIRSISFSGAVSASARVEVTLVQESATGLIGTIPSNVSIEQKQDVVVVRVEGVPDPTFRGINFYASRFQGGGATGYQRVNISTINDFLVIQETSSIGNLTVDSTVAANPDGTPAADPLYVKIAETQTSSSDVIEDLKTIFLTPELAAAITEQEQANLLKTDFVKVFEVPETTRVIRTTYTLDSVVSRSFYEFPHNRQFGPNSTPPTVPIGEFAATPLTESLFYVATAVFYDSERQIEIESAFSAEVTGKPTIIEENVGTFPAPARLQIVQDTIASITRTTPQVAIQPGAVLRDTVVDPVSLEVSRLRLLVDFLYRIQSFDTLLQVDGIEADGTSTPVARSPYKQGLQRVFEITNPSDVQTIIDTAFEQLASRNNVFRRAGVRARGFVTFFTRSRPTATLFIPLGSRVASGALQYVTTTDASIPIGNVAAFFNPTTGLYQIDVAIEADQPGANGVLGAGQIRTIVSSLPGLSVTNRNATFGGLDQQTNLQLAIEARNALAAVDSGTERGTLQTAANVAGVQGAQVVGAGDPLMQRDFDEDFNKHVGGKVDVWARGESIGNVTDTFAFTFEVANDVQFVLIGNPLSYMLRALDPNLSVNNPIAEMLDDASIGLGLRNATTGMFFDLTDVQILDYRTIQLSTAVVQPPVTFGNVVLGDYRYVTSTQFVFTRQPVSSVVRVTGEISGDLPVANYKFVQPDDPLLEGRSVRARSYLDIIQANGIPSGEEVSITSEQHILLGEFDEFVDNLGANPLTVTVFNSTRTVEYRGPDDPSGQSDYVIVPGTQTVAMGIRRTAASTILSGETVLIDYNHAENFTVEYQTNFVIPTLQQSLDAAKHVTADVLGKAAVVVPVDVTATIVTVSGFRSAVVDTNVRRNLATFFRSLPQGGAVRQSDVIAIIDNTRGVSYVETPLRKLTRSAGTIVVREPVPSTSGDVEVLLGNTVFPYSTDKIKTWILQDALNNPTSTGGGDGTQFAGVFMDDRPMSLLTSTPTALKDAAGRAYIIGNEGMSIPNYSDDATIQQNFPSANTAQEIAAIRQQLTGNRVLISLAADDRPQLHEYTITYTVSFVETRTQDIEASSIEVFDAGNFIFTFTEDRRLGQ
jgi:hypothetical protein